VPIAAVQKSLPSYFIGISFGQILYGPLSDRLGRKPALYVGLAIFVGASLGCAFTASVTQLVLFRFLQALGGCAPLVVPRAVVRDYFDGRESVRMLSMLILVMGVAPIVAPFVGGQLLIRFGWRSMLPSCWRLRAGLAPAGRLAAARKPAARTAASRVGGHDCRHLPADPARP
jgi:DHA1 family bicyclomycin/chloramphenicol resistance-like MFS transporter